MAAFVGGYMSGKVLDALLGKMIGDLMWCYSNLDGKDNKVEREAIDESTTWTFFLENKREKIKKYVYGKPKREYYLDLAEQAIAQVKASIDKLNKLKTQTNGMEFDSKLTVFQRVSGVAMHPLTIRAKELLSNAIQELRDSIENLNQKMKYLERIIS